MMETDVLVRIRFTDIEELMWYRIITIYRGDVERAYKIWQFFRDSEDYPEIDRYLDLLDEEMIYWEEEKMLSADMNKLKR